MRSTGRIEAPAAAAGGRDRASVSSIGASDEPDPAPVVGPERRTHPSGDRPAAGVLAGSPAGALNPTDPPAGPGPDEAGAPPTRPGTSTFTIEGRSAPGLFVVGWIATLVGLGCVTIAILSGGTSAARILLVVGLIPLSIGLIAGAGSQGIERRIRGRLPYVGPSPFLVLAAVVPVTALAGLLVGVPLRSVRRLASTGRSGRSSE